MLPRPLHKNFGFAAVCAGLLLFACRREKIVEVTVPTEKKSAWQEVVSLRFGDRLQLNAMALNDSQVLFRNQSTVTICNTNTLQTTGGFIWGSFEMEVAAKPSVHPQILVRSLPDLVQFSPLKQLVTSGSSTAVNPRFEGDTNFVRFPAQYINFNPQYHVIGNRYVLLPFVSKKDNETRSHAYLVRLLQTTISGIEAVRVDKVTTLALTSSVPSLPNTLYSSGVAFDKFFISVGATTFRVDTSGAVKEFGAPMYSTSDYFLLGNALFAINPNGRFYRSTDGGESWSLFANTGNSLFGFLGFEQVGEEVFAFYRDQIWHVTLKANELDFAELNNEGLERTLITSIVKAGDKAFVTTRYGVFYRKWTEFKQAKPK